MSPSEDTERNERTTRTKRSSFFTLTNGIIALVAFSFLLLLVLVYFGLFAGSNTRQASSRYLRPALSTRNNLIVYFDGNKLIGAYSTSNGIDGETIIQTTGVDIKSPPVLSKDKKYVYYRDSANHTIVKVDVDRKSSKLLHPPNFPYGSPQYSLNPDFVVDENDSSKIYYGFVISDNERKIRCYDSASDSSEDFDTMCGSNEELYVKSQAKNGSSLYYGCAFGVNILRIYEKNLGTNEVDKSFMNTSENSLILISRDGKYAITTEIGKKNVNIFNLSSKTSKTKPLGFKIEFDLIKNFGFSEDAALINIVKWEGRPIWKNGVRTIDLECLWNLETGFMNGPLAIRLLED